MFKNFKYPPLFYIVLQLALGYAGLYNIITKILFFVILLYAMYDIYKYKNQNEEAFLWACYFVGAEVFFRMTKSTISYEFTKYTVMLLLVFGMLVQNSKQNFSVSYFFYLMLLLLGIVFTDVPDGESMRKAIVFNLSGPVVLFISAFYFYKRNISRNKLLEGLFYMLLPMFSMIIYLYLRTPDLREIVFNSAANSTTSGGFGPNQVSTIIGLGMFILMLFLFLNKRISNILALDVIFLIYFTYRGLLTFSRGGIMAGVLVFFVFVFFMFLYKREMIKIIIKYFSIALIALMAIWLYTSNITGGMLDNRYGGKNSIGGEKEDLSSGRIDIILNQFESFYESPWFGIGVGNGKYKRIDSEENLTAASHNEITRLIEEHGAMGIIILFILLMVPLENILNSNNYQRAFLISFYALWFLTIGHSAMRIAFPGFIYGLSLIRINRDESTNDKS